MIWAAMSATARPSVSRRWTQGVFVEAARHQGTAFEVPVQRGADFALAEPLVSCRVTASEQDCGEAGVAADGGRQVGDHFLERRPCGRQPCGPAPGRLT